VKAVKQTLGFSLLWENPPLRLL